MGYQSTGDRSRKAELEAATVFAECHGAYDESEHGKPMEFVSAREICARKQAGEQFRVYGGGEILNAVAQSLQKEASSPLRKFLKRFGL